jgi:circadian clock protein KaiC
LVDLGAIRQELSKEEEIKEGGILTIKSLQEFISQSVKLTGAKRIVLDSLTAIALRYSEVAKIRQDFFRLGRFFRNLNATTLLTTEAVEGSLELTRYGIEQFITDSFVYIRLKDVQGQGLIRTIQIRKARHTNHDLYEHPVIFTDKGIEVSPEKSFFGDF